MKQWVYLLAAAGLAFATPSQAACVFGKVAELPVTMRGLRPTIATKINDQEAKFVVDSGAFYSLVSEDAAARLGMKPAITPAGLRLQGVGGHSAAAKVARAQTFSFAGATFKNVEFLIGGRDGAGETIGYLGQNILGTFDVEYDLANGYVRFFKATDCDKANLAYWSAGKTLSRLPLRGADGAQVMKIVTTAKIDGHNIDVVFDSGASVSVLSKPAAARAGVKPTSENAVSGGLSYGLFGGAIETWLAPFGSFAIGDEEVRNTQLRVADIEVPSADMLLGADFFLSHRILISRSQRKIYFTYNGGPVFRLDREMRQAEAGDAPSPTVAPAADAKTAAEFSLRGAASLSRGSFAAAEADFGRAIELEPQEARHYKDRARARLAGGRAVLAMADLAEALRRNPADIDALMTRGALYLASKDEASARADFEAAKTHAPGNDEVRIRIGQTYNAIGHYDAAIQEYDRWLAANPEADSVPQVLNERCWSRALLGKQLETALADCDVALKRGGRNSAFMDSRGLVLLRMGRLDEAIAQYDAALKLQPKQGWSLYGRGVAKLRRGDKAGGEADIAAAKAARPGIAEEASRLGVTVDAAARPAG